MTSFFLKIIASVCMLIDHIGAVFSMYTPWIFRCIGRISFPIYAYLVAEGCAYTRNLDRYMCRLGVFALLSEIPFDLAFHQYRWPSPDQPFPEINFLGATNVFYSLFLGVACVNLYEKLRRKKSLWFPILLALPAMASPYLLRSVENGIVFGRWIGLAYLGGLMLLSFLLPEAARPETLEAKGPEIERTKTPAAGSPEAIEPAFAETVEPASDRAVEPASGGTVKPAFDRAVESASAETVEPASDRAVEPASAGTAGRTSAKAPGQGARAAAPHKILAAIPILPMVLLGEVWSTDYGSFAVLFIIALRAARSRSRRLIVLLCGILCLYGAPLVFAGLLDWANLQLLLFALVAALLIFLYKGKRGPACKWAFYGFYPVHIALLAFVWFVLVRPATVGF
jgi:hypothetical protein